LISGLKPSFLAAGFLAAVRLTILPAHGADTLLPMSGHCPPELSSVDAALQRFMRERKFSAGTCAIMRKGTLVLERGYGWANREKTVAVMPDVRMRVASVSKVFTATAVKRLIAEGKFTTETPVFRYLGFNVANIPGADARLDRITVGQLLKHEGGWDREASFDPMFIDSRVQAAFGLRGPPGFKEILRYMLKQPLQFDPGSRTVYSNFGYCVLGQVIEKASGRSYDDFLKQEFLGPLGLKSVTAGARDRKAQEIWYDDPGAATINMESCHPSGGLIANAPDLCRFLQKYWISGEPRNPHRSQRWLFFGSLPGTTALVMQRPDGVDVAVLFNKRERDFKKQNEELRKLIDETLDRIKQWPK
jgi:CubicO group peptidase (beta-lactamase class C family)